MVNYHICANIDWWIPVLRNLSLISGPDTKPSISTSDSKNIQSYLAFSSVVTTQLIACDDTNPTDGVIGL